MRLVPADSAIEKQNEKTTRAEGVGYGTVKAGRYTHTHRRRWSSPSVIFNVHTTVRAVCARGLRRTRISGFFVRSEEISPGGATTVVETNALGPFFYIRVRVRVYPRRICIYKQRKRGGRGKVKIRGKKENIKIYTFYFSVRFLSAALPTDGGGY